MKTAKAACIAALLEVAACTLAQSADGAFTAGLRIGASHVAMSNLKQTFFFDGDKPTCALDEKRRVTPTVSIAAQYRYPTSLVDVEGSVSYFQTGGEVEKTATRTTETYDIKLNHITIGAGAKVYPVKGAFVKAAICAGPCLNGTSCVKYDATGMTNAAKMQVEERINKTVKGRTLVRADLSLGYDFPTGLTIEAFYGKCLTDLLEMGGTFSHSYQYDALDRLVGASGTAKDKDYGLLMRYDVMSNPVQKDSIFYEHDTEGHPNAVSRAGGKIFSYDADGNPISVEDTTANTLCVMQWDEEDRLQALGDDGYVSRYTYNHAGERVVKSHGRTTVAFVNGAPQGVLWHDKDNWTMYVSPYMVVSPDRFTKHYYAGSQRIASKIGTGDFNNLYDAAKTCVTAGQKDYAERLSQITQSRNDYYAATGIPPGPPTAKGAYGEAEYSGKYGGTPGPPVMYEKPSDPDGEGAGYGFVSSGAKEDDVYFYHPDHLGSTSYITDKDGNVTQFVSYKPYGEALVDEHSTSFDTPWKFNGKELDPETGLYYYGARYYEQTLALWYGVDALAEKYPGVGGYVYCAGKPVRLVDVDGNDWVEGENGIYWDGNVSSATDKNLKEGEKYLGVEGYEIDKVTGYTIHYDSNGYITATSIGLNEVEVYGNMMQSVVHKGQRDFIIGARNLALSPLNMFGNYVGNLIWGEGNHESYLYGSFELSCGPQLGIVR